MPEIIPVSAQIKVEPQLILLGSSDDDNPLCQCPVCGYVAGLMDGFSLLAVGFNGIKNGSVDNVNMQECGFCETRLGWDALESEDA